MGLRDLLRRRRPPGWLDPGEPWAVQAMRDSRGAEAWADLIEHAATLNQAKPTIKWRKQAALLVAAAGRDEVRDALARWFALVGQDARGPIAEPNASVLRGLAWYPVVLEDESLAAPLGELADACFRKIPDVGARSVKAGNAALAALAELPGTAGAAQLGRMRSRLKLPSAQERVAAAMGTAAERAGVSPDELEELAVPTFGLGPGSTLTRSLGEYDAVLSVGEGVELSWRRGDRTRKTIPEAVKRDHASELDELKAVRKELKALLPAQRARLERLLTRPHGWPLETWRERYLDHPVVGALARRLIWRVGDEPAIWWDGRLVDRRDREVEVGGDARVTLWHPIESDVETVQGWRLWLEEHLVVQPFKQAHREVYLLTDAERDTGTYSNRFAGHILRQHQLASLLRERGWRYTLQGAWDSANTPHAPALAARADRRAVAADDRAGAGRDRRLHIRRHRPGALPRPGGRDRAAGPRAARRLQRGDARRRPVRRRVQRRQRPGVAGLGRRPGRRLRRLLGRVRVRGAVRRRPRCAATCWSGSCRSSRSPTAPGWRSASSSWRAT